MTSKYLIYGLTDPRTGNLRYVGKSCTGLSRPKAHFHPTKLKESTKKNSWIKSLKAQGLLPGIEILEEHEGPFTLSDSECFWIANVKACGAELLNMTDGGDGAPGRVQSKEEKTKRSNLAKARFKLHGSSLRGYKHSQATRETMSRVRIGKRLPKKTREQVIRQVKSFGANPFFDLATGVLYQLIPDAVAATGLGYMTITSSLKGRTRHNKRFRYQEPGEPSVIEGGYVKPPIKYSEEAKAAMRGRPAPWASTPEARAAMSEGQKKRNPRPAHAVLHIESGEIFRSVDAASAKLRINRTSIYAVCDGKQEQVKKQHFCWADEPQS